MTFLCSYNHHKPLVSFFVFSLVYFLFILFHCSSDFIRHSVSDTRITTRQEFLLKFVLCFSALLSGERLVDLLANPTYDA